jgi:predicted TIM-barrel fold metal-dependent hydrolase
MHYISSMVTHGLFDTFPSLNVMFLEFGFLWVPPLMWRLDALYDVLRAERPVKTLPSETIAQHMKFSMQPLDYVPKQKDAVEAVRACSELRSMLCFSSDYPHWDADDPKYVASHVPREWKDDVMYGNAKAFYGTRVGSAAPSS